MVYLYRSPQIVKVVQALRTSNKILQKVLNNEKIVIRIAIPEARETMEQDKKLGKDKKDGKEKGIKQNTSHPRVPALTNPTQENESNSEEESEEEIYLNTKDVEKLKEELVEVKVYTEKCMNKMKEELYIATTK